MGMIRQYYWGIAMKEHKTVWLTVGSATQTVAMILIIVLLIIIGAFPNDPALVGAVAIIGGTIFECISLWIQRRIGLVYST